ncbi:histone H2A-1 [Mycena latifolia]|nr:histone H2A-1 [Mycena latifolia]
MGKGKGKGKTTFPSGTSRTSSSVKAGVVFPVGRIHRILREGNYARRVSMGGAVYLAAVLEYLTAELLELAGNCARDNHKVRVIPRHLLLAIKNDNELDQLLKHTVIYQGGVIPYIHSCLIPKKSISASRAESDAL